MRGRGGSLNRIFTNYALNTLKSIKDRRLIYKEKLISPFTFITYVKVIKKVSLNVKIYRIFKCIFVSIE